jgi:putative ABC transport system substrate-binding protein
MERRTFLAMVPGSLLAVPLAAAAQQAGKVYRVGLIFPSPPVSEMAGPEPLNVAARAFVRGMRALGYVEGGNLILERRSAEGRFWERLLIRWALAWRRALPGPGEPSPG